MVRLMLYLLTVTTNDVVIKIGLSHWVRIDVLALIHERFYFCLTATRIKILWVLEENIYSFFMKLEHFQDLYELIVVLKLERWSQYKHI